MVNHLVSKREKLAVIGLGYVGLPIALEFAKKLSVIGFDINQSRVELMQRGIDPSKELEPKAFLNCDIEFTYSVDKLKEARFYIIAVPTPVDQHNVPDLRPLKRASETVGRVIKRGDYIVFESTVYPGCTEEDCLPIIEKTSGLRLGRDFKLGYSPERINPGDKEHTLTNIVKVVSGSDVEALDTIAKVYEMVVKAGVHRASSIKVAEAAKIIENTQRDINIALMNELSIIFEKMGINTLDVLEAAGTKWNFLNFRPGLVGGHCIGVDPYYLTYKAAELGFSSKVITAGRSTNDSMAAYVAKKVLQHLILNCDDIKKSKVLVLGTTFKENISDIRNSKVPDIVKELASFQVEVKLHDPHACPDQFFNEYGFALSSDLHGVYDVLIIAVPHSEYSRINIATLLDLVKPAGFVFDLKGMFRGRIKDRTYITL